MIRFPLKTTEEEQESWISIADLMSVLMLVFLLIAIVYIQFQAQSAEERKTLEEALGKPVAAWLIHQKEIYKALMEEFDKDLDKWDAEIEEKGPTVRFRSPSVLFPKGSAEIRLRFKEILRDFWPRYIRVLDKRAWRDDIEEIRIEGHTSSEWEGAASRREAYFKNMELSQNRTRAVMEFCLSLYAVRRREAWLLEKVTANGLSSSRLVKNWRDTEDKKASRRVEFRVSPKIITQEMVREAH